MEDRISRIGRAASFDFFDVATARIAMSSSQRSKRYTVEEANRSLPLVRMIVRDWVSLSSKVAERRERVAYLMAGRDPKVADVYGDELQEVQSSLDRAAKRLDRYVGELVQLGVRPFDANSGAVDFPTRIDGEDAVLCWEYDEPEVTHWRYDGDQSRRPLGKTAAVSDSTSEMEFDFDLD